MLYLYALTGGDLRGAVLPRGVAGEAVGLVAAGGFQVAAGAVAAAPRCGAEPLRAHDAVVRALFRGGAAVLPLRFGQVAPDEAALGLLLERRAEALADALTAVAGGVQMTVRVFDAGPLSEPAPALPEGAGPGTRYLAARRGASRTPLDAWRAEVRPLLRAEVVRASPRRPGSTTIDHLLSREDLPVWRDRLEAWRAGIEGCRIAVSGPWPPYAFARTVPR